MNKIMRYDLEERTAIFGENVLKFLTKIKRDDLNRNIVNQLVRAATSVGANYMEANGASSKRDFKNKIHLCKKEIMETKYWLRMIAQVASAYKTECRTLWREAHELRLIFSKIASSSK